MDYESRGDVPQGRGMGSSAAVRAGSVAGLSALTGDRRDREGLVRLAAQLDNAPDNACAVFAGGFCIARTESSDFAYREHVRFDLPEALEFVAVSPHRQVINTMAK